MSTTLMDRNMNGHKANGVLEEVSGREYNGVWKAWKLGSLGLFAVFVFAFVGVSRTLKRIERRLGA